MSTRKLPECRPDTVIAGRKDIAIFTESEVILNELVCTILIHFLELHQF